MDKYYKPKNRYSPDFLKEMKDRSFENLVHFYAEELQHIINGGTNPPVLSKRLRKKLRQYGIIELLRSKVDRGYVSLKVTPRAVNILRDVLEVKELTKMGEKTPSEGFRIAPRGAPVPASVEASFSIKEGEC